MRVQRLLAQAGVAARRRCEEFIQAGRVSVNGRVATIGESASADDDVRVDGVRVQLEKKVYIALNKPGGVTSTVADPHAESTVLSLVKVPQRIVPVGRLDKYTDGLILLSNDGEFINRITHPRYGVWKTYRARVVRPLRENDFTRLHEGVMVEGRRVLTRGVRQHEADVIELQIHEGRKHIVRVLLTTLGCPVRTLTRIAIGPLQLGALKKGRWRELTPAEVAALLKAASPTKGNTQAL